MLLVAANHAVRFFSSQFQPYLTDLSTFHAVHSRKSQSYEPLLLENEREAVADLLQYLESACFICASHHTVLNDYGRLQTEQRPISSLVLHFPRSPHSHFPTTSIFNGARHWLLLK